jgi:hypothetical protein
MRPQRPRNQPKPAHQQNQHHQSIEQARRSKINAHVGDHASQNEKRTRRRYNPPRHASPVPKQNPHAQQHRHQRNPKCVRPVKTPVRPHHTHLIRQKISPQASHDAPNQKMPQPARRPAHIPQRSVFHSRSIPNLCPRLWEKYPAHRPLLLQQRNRRKTFHPRTNRQERLNNIFFKPVVATSQFRFKLADYARASPWARHPPDRTTGSSTEFKKR